MKNSLYRVFSPIGSAARKAFRPTIHLAFTVGGVGLIAVGLWMCWPPLALIFVGIVMLAEAMTAQGAK
jgi:hypothetical protein